MKTFFKLLNKVVSIIVATFIVFFVISLMQANAHATTENPISATACAVSAENTFICTLDDGSKIVLTVEQSVAIDEPPLEVTFSDEDTLWASTVNWSGHMWRTAWNESVYFGMETYYWSKSFLGYEQNALYSTALVGGTTATLTGAAAVGTTGLLGTLGIVTAPAWAPFAIAGGTVIALGGGVMLAVDNYDSYRWEDFKEEFPKKEEEK